LGTGFDELLQVAQATGKLNAEKLESFKTMLIEADQMSSFYASVNLIVVAGQK
jgi:hypothetical protein